MWLKIISVLKFILKLLLHFFPPQVIAEYITEEKRVLALAAKFKAVLNTNPTLAKTKVDDYTVDRLAESWAKLGKCLKQPDSKEINWLKGKTKELDKLTDK